MRSFFSWCSVVFQLMLCFPVWTQPTHIAEPKDSQPMHDPKLVVGHFSDLCMMADSLEREGKYDKALQIYSQCLETDVVSPVVLEAMGNIYRKTGNWKEARRCFTELAKRNPMAAEMGLAHCDFATTSLSRSQEYDAFLLPFNTEASECNMSFFQDNPCFSTFRCTGYSSTDQKSQCNTQPIPIIYNPDVSGLVRWKQSEPEYPDFDFISVSQNGRSAIALEGGKSDRACLGRIDNKTTLTILSLDDTGTITKAFLFPFSANHPFIHSACLSEDGRELVFSSHNDGQNQGFDLYKSILTENEWSKPENLGMPVNTIGNEITPFYQNNVLYFASDAHPGLGGFDIFVSGIHDGEWLPPRNVGTGINSIGDDYYPALDGIGKMYFTSNRQGGKGRNDLYYGFRLVDQHVPASEIPKAIALHQNDPVKATIWTQNQFAKAVAYIETGKNENDPKRLFQKRSGTEKETNENKVGANGKKENTLEQGNRVRNQSRDDDHPTATAQNNGIIQPTNTDTAYFIQLISIAPNEVDHVGLDHVRHLGNLYTVEIAGNTKIQIGRYTTKQEARKHAEDVKRAGFPDAFVTLNPGIPSSSIRPFSGQNHRNQHLEKRESTKTNVGEVKYKIRLGAFAQAHLFDDKKVTSIGTVERWTKGKWTIILLSGYQDIGEAKLGLAKAKLAGFSDAQLVKENLGEIYVVSE